MTPKRDQGRLVLPSHQNVRGDRCAWRSTPRTSRSAGTWATPAARISRAERPTSGRPPSVIEPWLAGRRPGDDLGEFGLAVAGDAGNADDLAGPNIEGNAAQRRQAGVRHAPRGRATSSTVSPERRLARPAIEIHDAADHHLDELGLGQPGRPPRRDLLAVAKDGHRVGDLHHLFEMMRDEDAPSCPGRRSRGASETAPGFPAASARPSARRE